MTITPEQSAALLARFFPEAQLRSLEPVADDRTTLLLSTGDRLTVQQYATVAGANAAAQALDLLRAEIDLPIPQLRGADAEGAISGTPSLLLSEVTGEPLARVLPRLSDNQAYDLGRRLGEIVFRVHRLRTARYGEFSDELLADDERAYVLARLARDLGQAQQLGLLDRATSEQIRDWFATEFQPIGREPALLHGDLGPETILVRRSDEGWRISALIGWECAVGWAPAWEHVTFLAAADVPSAFSLRVGYGNRYDEQTERVYEQLRETVLLPYRMLLALRELLERRFAGDLAAADRARARLLSSMRIAAGEM